MPSHPESQLRDPRAYQMQEALDDRIHSCMYSAFRLDDGRLTSDPWLSSENRSCFIHVGTGRYHNLFSIFIGHNFSTCRYPEYKVADFFRGLGKSRTK